MKGVTRLTTFCRPSVMNMSAQGLAKEELREKI